MDYDLRWPLAAAGGDAAVALLALRLAGVAIRSASEGLVDAVTLSGPEGAVVGGHAIARWGEKRRGRRPEAASNARGLLSFKFLLDG